MLGWWERRSHGILDSAVWLGHVDYHAAVRSGGIHLDGPVALAREFPRWLMWSPMARYVRADRERRRASGRATTRGVRSGRVRLQSAR